MPPLASNFAFLFTTTTAFLRSSILKLSKSINFASAAKAGGGTNHRMSLNDQALIKDNHIVASGSIKSAVEKVKDKFPELEFEIEVDNLDQLNEALVNLLND